MMGGGKRCRRYEFGAICKANRPRGRRPVSCRDNAGADLRMLVSRVVVEDHANQLSGRHLRPGGIARPEQNPIGVEMQVDDLARREQSLVAGPRRGMSTAG